MRKFSKTLGLFLAVMLLFTAAVTAYAQDAELMCWDPCPPTKTTKVTIHKVVGTGGFELIDHDGRKLNKGEIEGLGDDATEYIGPDIEFTLWKVDKGIDIGALNSMDIDELNSKYSDHSTYQAGQTFDLEDGTYYLRETKHPDNYVDPLGVPSILDIPALSDNGDRLTEVHIYPKNVLVEEPEIDKDVREKDNDNAGFDIGEVFEYLIYPTVPKGIEDYSRFEIYDRLDQKLDYMGQVTVTYNDKVFVSGTDYTLLGSPGAAGGYFIVRFREEGLQKLAENRPENETEKDLEISFKARINKDAVMGEQIWNNAEITFQNKHMEQPKEVDVPEEERPEVHTGGRKFIKVDFVEQEYKTSLKDAEFIVKRQVDGGYEYMNFVPEGQKVVSVTWVDRENASRINLDVNQGVFEVKGLAYGDDGTAFEYWLEEVEVPDGYVKMDDLTFEIDANSYGKQNQIKVANVKKPRIPQTGGIGTLVFSAAGLSLMSAALVILKRKDRSDK
ncbi:MAG TPA: SpaH/EbpB family LPXTG-anchored major pilin [Bacillota bacterium]|nr:SpaH/EbpB family LPXTG-anchored major pilin [Bacillota bacterium]